jgi:hypothetical protein
MVGSRPARALIVIWPATMLLYQFTMRQLNHSSLTCRCSGAPFTIVSRRFPPRNARPSRGGGSLSDPPRGHARLRGSARMDPGR